MFSCVHNGLTAEADVRRQTLCGMLKDRHRHTEYFALQRGCSLLCYNHALDIKQYCILKVPCTFKYICIQYTHLRHVCRQNRRPQSYQTALLSSNVQVWVAFTRQSRLSVLIILLPVLLQRATAHLTSMHRSLIFEAGSCSSRKATFIRVAPACPLITPDSTSMFKHFCLKMFPPPAVSGL